MNLREFAKIGKNVIKQITNKVEYYIDKDFIPEVISDNKDKDKKYITKQHRLNKSQMLLFVYYHFCQVDSRGFIRTLSVEDVARDLNVSTRTIHNNNIVLQEVDLIAYSRMGNSLNIVIKPYTSYFTEGGSGYLELSYKRFKEMLAIEHVNATRLELRKELIYDNHEISRKVNKQNTPYKISFVDFKAFTPKYTHYKGKVEEIAQKGSAGFKTVVRDSHIFFNPNDSYINSKEEKAERERENLTRIETVINDYHCAEFFISTHKKDFTQLSLEYSIEQVVSALTTLIQVEFYGTDTVSPSLKQNDALKNYGAMVRTLIRRQYIQKMEILATPGEFIA